MNANAILDFNLKFKKIKNADGLLICFGWMMKLGQNSKFIDLKFLIYLEI